MQKYRVVSYNTKTADKNEYNFEFVLASMLREEFDLFHLSVQDVYIVWSNYSDSLSAGWIEPSKEGVEKAFGVTLEKINNG